MTSEIRQAIPFARPLITDRERSAVLEVLKGDILTHGPQNRAFEEEFSVFIGGGSCAAVSSCMAALHLSYLEMGIGPGDEVIVPAQTHVATAHAVEMVGARPVFVDCELQTGNLDIAILESRITPKTRAIGLVHFVGIPCDMESIMEIARRYQLKVIEDCALAVGSRFQSKHCGLFGDAGCFSFYPVKHMTTGDGGMFVSTSNNLTEKIRITRGFGVDRTFSQRSIPGVYDVPSLGLNYRMSDINAALGRVQLSRMDDFLELRARNFDTLRNALEHVDELTLLDSPTGDFANSHYCLTAILNGRLAGSRNEIVSKLRKDGVGTSIYYPQPVPRMSYYRRKYGYDASRYPNATAISDHSVALPVGPHLDTDDVDYIADTLIRTIAKVKS